MRIDFLKELGKEYLRSGFLATVLQSIVAIIKHLWFSDVFAKVYQPEPGLEYQKKISV